MSRNGKAQKEHGACYKIRHVHHGPHRLIFVFLGFQNRGGAACQKIIFGVTVFYEIVLQPTDLFSDLVEDKKSFVLMNYFGYEIRNKFLHGDGHDLFKAIKLVHPLNVVAHINHQPAFCAHFGFKRIKGQAFFLEF